MKITVITSNKLRHNYLINKLSNICSSLYVIQESSTIFPGINFGRNKKSITMKKYFSKVELAQQKLFSDHFYIRKNKKIEILPLQFNDLNLIKLSKIKRFFQSDIYIIFGSSFIKGEIFKFLNKKKAINIHMGVSPYFRGTDCNFWAINDGYPGLVGATIHYLSNTVDGGEIIYHATSKINKDPFLYTMSSVKSAIDSLVHKIKKKQIFSITPVKQDFDKQIRYSTKKDFTDNIVKKFLKKKFSLFENKKINIKLINNHRLKSNR